MARGGGGGGWRARFAFIAGLSTSSYHDNSKLRLCYGECVAAYLRSVDMSEPKYFKLKAP